MEAKNEMTQILHPNLAKATRLTREGRLAEATALLQQTLRIRTHDGAKSASAGVGTDLQPQPEPTVIDGVAERIEDPGRSPSDATDWSNLKPRADQQTAEPAAPPQRHLPKALRDLLGRLGRISPGMGSDEFSKPSSPASALVPAGGRFISGSYANGAGIRTFKLYVPSRYSGEALPLIVMLHGCTQSADDFAAGTRMNLVAEEQPCLVLYPEQSPTANPSKCWNWFNPSDQQRDQGEPSLIAGMTGRIMRDYAVDARRVYVAGLSAGAATAAIMGTAYPELYAAIGVHSGLACGAASDLPSAFAAMRQGAAAARHFSGGGSGERQIVPTIVFHGDQDATVHPGNADRVIAQSLVVPVGHLTPQLQQGRVPGGHAYSRYTHTDADGRTLLEQWVIHGLGHAWSGGSPAGTYTDPRGPDAAREMSRFFLAHAHFPVS
jgi:poly(hydroxyalkanoate) depolymerase family esterase